MENLMWPGAYSFKKDLKALLEVIQQQIEIIISKINELDALAK